MTNINGPSGPNSTGRLTARPGGPQRNFSIRKKVQGAIPDSLKQKAGALGEKAKGWAESGASLISKHTPQSFKNHLSDLGAKIPTKKAMSETAQNGMAAIRQKLSTAPGSAQLKTAKKAVTDFGAKISDKASHAGKQFLDKDMVKKARSFAADKASVLSQKAPIQKAKDLATSAKGKLAAPAGGEGIAKKAKAKTDSFSNKMMDSFRGALEDMKSGKGKERMTGAYQSAKASGSKKFNELSSQALEMAGKTKGSAVDQFSRLQANPKAQKAAEMFQGAKAKSYTKLGEAADAAKRGAGGVSDQFTSLMASPKGREALRTLNKAKATSSAKLGDAVTAAKKGTGSAKELARQASNSKVAQKGSEAAKKAAEKLAGSKAGKAGVDAARRAASSAFAKSGASGVAKGSGKAAAFFAALAKGAAAAAK